MCRFPKPGAAHRDAALRVLAREDACYRESEDAAERARRITRERQLRTARKHGRWQWCREV